MRAYHDQALINEFQRRGIDTTSVYDGKAISFAHPVRCPRPYNRLVVLSPPLPSALGKDVKLQVWFHIIQFKSLFELVAHIHRSIAWENKLSN
jgi:hypothetical protein